MRGCSMGEESRPLPSPSRSSLRSGRPPTRDKARVTFASDYSGDYTPFVESNDPDRPASQGPTPQPHDPDPDPLPQALLQAPKAWDSECSPAHWLSTTASLTPLLLASDPHRETDLEARTNRLLELTSDLYVATHLSDEVAPLRRFSARRSVSVDRLLDHQSPRLQPASRPRRGGSPQRQTMDQSCLAALSPPSPDTTTGLGQAGLSLSSTPPGSDLRTRTTYHPTNTTQSSRQGGGDGRSVPRTPSPQPGVSELSSTLRGLLDLVDQHWSGTHSLHTNTSFLGRAYDLLSALMPPAVPCPRGREGWRDGQSGGEDETESDADVTPRCSDLGLLKRKLALTQQQLESLKKRLVAVLKENYNLRLTSLKQEPSVTAVTNCDRQWDRCLQRQVKALKKQETHLRHLELTLELLRDNNRSLVSNNNSLLGQLRLNGCSTGEAGESIEAARSTIQENPATLTH